jgi:radical SAM superfamily enzyme YgiQ (UPF0313 family)
MKNNSVVFIAFLERENLGIGYMHTILSGAGYKVHILDVRKEKAEILQELQMLDPVLVGFSVIFENYIYDFQELIKYLRSQGIHTHFTAGGHFASLRPEELFKIAPELDSIVRFEGEHSILDLVNQLHHAKDWKKLSGISYRANGSLTNNPLRPLEPDLDVFPYPFRSMAKEYALGKKYTTLLAGRGCIYNCAFCDIREFYGQPPGPVKRIRKAEKVAEEIAFLYDKYDCSIFLFQDDDFPVKVNRTSDWVKEFCSSLKERKLEERILWKINCRPDEVDQELFRLMKEHGLFQVYLGIEDGTDEGLHLMDKRLKVSDHLQGVQILKELGLSIYYGFMLFQPSSTYASVNENLNFLEQISQDGYMPVSFLKMMPYLATRIEKELKEAGRLKGQPGFLDYDFLEKSLDDYYFFVSESFNTWFNAPGGLSNYLKWDLNYLYLLLHYYDTLRRSGKYSNAIFSLVAETNHFVIKTMRELSEIFESGDYSMENDPVLDGYRKAIEEKHSSSLKQASDLIDRLEVFHLTKGLIV